MNACRGPWAATLALLLCAASTDAAGTPVGTTALERARQARFAGKLDDAERWLIQAMREQPGDYQTLYNMGLVHESRAVQAPPGEPRRRHYRVAARWLERAHAARGKSTDYTIYNSLGAVYLGMGDLASADRYLSEGLRHEGRLTNASRAKLYANTGYLYALRGDNRQALLFFERGARLGSGFAEENRKRLTTGAKR